MVRKTLNLCVGLSILVNAIIIVAVVSSCGGRNGYTDGGDEQSPPPDDTDGGGSDDWGAVKAALDSQCARCHDGTNQKAFDSRQRLLSSKAAERIDAGTMPPGGGGNAEAKAKIVMYVKRNR